MSEFKPWQRVVMAVGAAAFGACFLGLLWAMAPLAHMRSPEFERAIIAHADEVSAKESENPGEAKGLRVIWAERSDIKRLNALAEWVAMHSETDCLAALWALRGSRLAELRTLLLAKLVEENPGESSAKLDARLERPEDPKGEAIWPSRYAELDELAKTKPLEALNLALSEKWLKGSREKTVERIFYVMAKADPKLAFATFEKSHGFDRVEIIRSITQVAAQKDLEMTLSWIRSQPASPANRQLIEIAVGAASEVDLEAAVETAIAEPALSQNQKVTYLLVRWLKQDLDASAKWLVSQPYVDSSLRQAAAVALTSSHPEAVAVLLAQPMPSYERPRLLLDVATSFATKDPTAAQRWIDSQPRGDGYLDANDLIDAAVAAKKPTNAENLPRLE